MNHLQKHFSASLIALAALTAAPMAAWGAAPDMTALSSFAVLGGTAVTCTDSLVIGDVGISPGAAAAFTNTRCTIAGSTPPATNAAAANAQAALTTAYNNIQNGQTGDCTDLVASDIPGQPNNTGNTLGRDINTLSGVTLTPGYYCINDTAKTGTLTLDATGSANPATAVWIFKTIRYADGALTGTGFTVTMAGGGQACNVFWAPVTAATMTTSAFKGNILAGNTTVGSITLTASPLDGRALAHVAVTMTDSVSGCGGLGALSNSLALVCKVEEHKKHEKCNQGVGNGSEGCDPGHSDKFPWSSNDENGGKPGDPGRKGGNK